MRRLKSADLEGLIWMVQEKAKNVTTDEVVKEEAEVIGEQIRVANLV
jgi:hypothetical protein